jgi:hypothetical protein
LILHIESVYDERNKQLKKAKKSAVGYAAYTLTYTPQTTACKAA